MWPPQKGPMDLQNRPLVHAKVLALAKAITEETKKATNIWHRMKVSMTWQFLQHAVQYSMRLPVNKVALNSVPATAQGSPTDQEIFKWFIEKGRAVKPVVDSLNDFPILAIPRHKHTEVIIEAGHHRASAMEKVIEDTMTRFDLDLKKSYIESWTSRDEMLTDTICAVEVSILIIPELS